MAARFGVNRHTLRRAVAALAAQGVVQARMGAGVVVTTGRRIDYPLGRRVRFHATLAAQGASGARSILTTETRRADGVEAAALGVAAGTPVHVCTGTSHADGAPVALFRSVFPAARFPALIADLRDTGSVTAALTRAGVADYTRARTEVGATLADAVQAVRLRVAEGAALLVTRGVNVDGAGVAVEYGTTWFCADRVTLTVTPD